MLACINHGKTSLTIGIVAENESETHRLTLKMIVSKNLTTTAANVTAGLNIHLEDPDSTKLFDDVFTNPTSTVQLQLLNL